MEIKIIKFNTSHKASGNQIKSIQWNWIEHPENKHKFI